MDERCFEKLLPFRIPRPPEKQKTTVPLPKIHYDHQQPFPILKENDQIPCICLFGSTPQPVTVTTKVITFLVGNSFIDLHLRLAYFLQGFPPAGGVKLPAVELVGSMASPNKQRHKTGAESHETSSKHLLSLLLCSLPRFLFQYRFMWLKGLGR